MTATPPTVLRAHAEDARADELDALARLDEKQRPPGWRLSPWSVVTFVMGGRLKDGTDIIPKYIGDRRLVEIAVATLATDRALLLLGVPGTAKSWRQSAATRPCSSRAPPVPAKRQSDLAGTTPGCSQTARRGQPSSRVR